MIYEYKCEECEHVTEIFCEMKDRKSKVPCEKCCKNAKRLYTIGGAFIKKVRVEDVWRREGINVDDGETPDRKRSNAKRIKKMREEDARKKGKR